MSRLGLVGWVVAGTIVLPSCLISSDDDDEHDRCPATTATYEGAIDDWRIRAPYTVSAWFSSSVEVARRRPVAAFDNFISHGVIPSTLGQ